MSSARVLANRRGIRWRRWLVIGCLVGAYAAAGPWVWRQAKFFIHLRTARYALTKFAADNAVFELRAAEKFHPESAEVQYLLGIANRKAGHIDDVRSHLEKASELGWPKKDVRFQLTLLAFQAGDPEAEAELKQTALRPMDDDTAEQLYESLSLGYLAEYRVGDAMMVLDHWVEWRPKCIRPRLLRAEVFDITSQRRQQQDEYEKIIEADPENYAAHLGLAHLLASDHNADQSLTHYHFCHRQWPADPVPTLGIAACLQQQGKLAEAKQILNEMLEQNLPPAQRASVLSEMAEMAQQERDLPSAVKLMSEAVQLDPQSSQLHYMLGVCLAKSGRAEEAKQYTERSREIDRLSQRRSDLEHEMLSSPNDPSLRYEIGELLAKLGHSKASAAMMLSALRRDPRHRGAHAALARYYEEIGREDLAQKHRLLGDEEDQNEDDENANNQKAAAQAFRPVPPVGDQGS